MLGSAQQQCCQPSQHQQQRRSRRAERPSLLAVRGALAGRVPAVKYAEGLTLPSLAHLSDPINAAVDHALDALVELLVGKLNPAVRHVEQPGAVLDALVVDDLDLAEALREVAPGDGRAAWLVDGRAVLLTQSQCAGRNLSAQSPLHVLHGPRVLQSCKAVPLPRALQARTSKSQSPVGPQRAVVSPLVMEEASRR